VGTHPSDRIVVIIPQGIRTTILRFSEERFGLALLIVDPYPEPLLERLVVDG